MSVSNTTKRVKEIRRYFQEHLNPKIRMGNA